MSTKMTETDWAVALEVFQASLPRRGAKGRDDRLFASLSASARLVQMFDSTIVRAHVSAAGAKGGRRTKRSAAHAAASPPRSI